jgi:beta-1,4-N-acetylglucosaminyltransferase
MIFVTVGTTDFDALVRRMDELAPGLGEEVVCQIGKGACVPRHCRSFRYAPSLEEELRRARLVVSHGGLGTMMEAIRLGKPLVGVSNPDRRDLHQDDLLGTLEAGDHIVWCRNLGDLAGDLARVPTTKFVPFAEAPCTIHTAIGDFLRGESAARVRRGRTWRRASSGWRARAS